MMINSIPPFNSKNYPHTYKVAKDILMFPKIIIGAALACFIFSLIENYGVPLMLNVGALFSLPFFIAGSLVFLERTNRQLTLNADSIEYRSFFVTRFMKREDIKGTRWLFFRGGYNYSPHSRVVCLPKEDNGKYLVFSRDIFNFDELYDAWIGTLPYINGTYWGGYIEDATLIRWNSEGHCWEPRSDVKFSSWTGKIIKTEK